MVETIIAEPDEKKSYKFLLNEKELLSSSLWSEVWTATGGNLISNSPPTLYNLVNRRSIEITFGSLQFLPELSSLDRLIADQAMNFKISSARDGTSKSKKNLKSSEKLSIDTELVLYRPKPSGKQKGSRRRIVEFHDDDSRSILIGKDANVFGDPSSIDDHIRVLATEPEQTYLTSIRSTGAIDEALYASYKATLALTFARKYHKSQHDKLVVMERGRSKLKKEKMELVTEVKAFKEEATKEKMEMELKFSDELESEKKTVSELTTRLESIAMDAVIKTRAVALMEYKYGRHIGWDVDAEIMKYKARLPDDYEDSFADIAFEPLGNEMVGVDDGDLAMDQVGGEQSA